jgi:hypothetical protein
MTDRSKYDYDPEALAWARVKVQAENGRCRKIAEQADAAHTTEQFELWRRQGNWLERTFIGDGSCVIARFDERLPEFAKAVDRSIPPAIDRAIRRDHGLCGTEPCSDCR